MPFDLTTVAPLNIAVIGAGITGLGAAHALSKAGHRVTIYEAEGRLGGHARTRMAGHNGDQAVDTGFIVFNKPNYPNLTALFDELGVASRASSMSFGASFGGGRFEYGVGSLGAVFAQPANMLDPRFVRMIRDIFRFNAKALTTAETNPGMTIGGLLDALGTGAWFRERYILPLSGAIWSTPTRRILDFPADAMMRFFENHALLHHTGQHQWFTVEGGSQTYVTRLEAALRRAKVDIRLGAPIAGVRRGLGGVELRAVGGEWETYDEVVMATHPDIALSKLADASGAEARALGGFSYQPNRVVLHSDTAIMPRRRKVWSAWNFAEAAGEGQPISLSYWMNELQPWLKGEDFFVTLNPVAPIRDELIWDEVTLRHPLYDQRAFAAQRAVQEVNGQRGIWFCGAWMRNGFHEDGLTSGLEVATALAARPPMSWAAE